MTDFGQHRGRRALAALAVLVVLGGVVAYVVLHAPAAQASVAEPAVAELAPLPHPVKKKAAVIKARRKKAAVAPEPAVAVAAPVPVLPLTPAPLIAAPFEQPVETPWEAPVKEEKEEEAFTGNGEEIARLIARAKRDAVQRCYEHELKSRPTLRGEVNIELELAAPQRVEAVRVKDDLDSPAFTQCVLAAMQHVKFPALNEDVSVQLPFVLMPRGK